MTRFLGWYLAVVLAAYGLSASWALGIAAERVATTEAQLAQIASDLQDMRAERVVQSDRCEYIPEAPSCKSVPS